MYYPYPSQNNDINCGLFAVVVVLHIIDGIAVEKTTFDQSSITDLRKELAHHLLPAVTLLKHPLPAIICQEMLSLLTADDQS